MTEHAPDPVDVHVGARVRLLRKRLGVTQQALADAIGLTFQQVQKYERGQNRISASVLHRIARALSNAEIAWFFEGAPGGSEVADDSRAAARAVDELVLRLVTAPYGARLASSYAALCNQDRQTVADLAERLAAGPAPAPRVDPVVQMLRA